MNKIFDYTNLTLNELIEKISTARFFHLPKMLEEILGRLVPQAPKYKVYSVLLTQTGTDAPTANILENTLGYVPTLNYSNIGNYSITLQNAPFTSIFIPTWNFNFSTGSMTIIPNDDNDIGLQSLNTLEEVSNSIINSIPIEIRVYN